jgi:hypothetical protein
MENKKNRIAAAIGGLMLCASFAANATLEPRLSGMAYYDTDTDITWAALTHTINLGLNFFEYEEFMPTFEIGGYGGWGMPTQSELINLVYNHSIIIGAGAGAVPLPPFDSMGWWEPTWYWTADVISGYPGMYANAFSPSMLVTYPFTEKTIDFFGVWPMHHGDVPLLAVPEPNTYAMLLAGLGLFGYIGRRQTKQ